MDQPNTFVSSARGYLIEEMTMNGYFDYVEALLDTVKVNLETPSSQRPGQTIKEYLETICNYYKAQIKAQKLIDKLNNYNTVKKSPNNEIPTGEVIEEKHNFSQLRKKFEETIKTTPTKDTTQKIKEIENTTKKISAPGEVIEEKHDFSQLRKKFENGGINK